jgi:hypothetical protein
MGFIVVVKRIANAPTLTMNLYASTLKGIKTARGNKHRRLQEEMAAAAFRNEEKKARGLRWASAGSDTARCLTPHTIHG